MQSYRCLTQTRSMSDLVKTSLENGVQLISINRPEKKNCVNHDTAKQLIKAFEEFEINENAKIAVFYGEGGNFCTGYDLSEVASGKIKDIDSNFVPKYRYMGPSAMRLRKPLIAAVEGYAVAGGLELSLLADLRVASKDATFGVFCRRVGVPLIDGGTVRLPKIVGLARALDLTLTGRPLEGKEALEWGLVNRLVENGKAVSTAIALAQSIISNPYDCLLADRDSIYNSLDVDFQTAMAHELKSLAVLPQSEKGAEAFLNHQIKPPCKL